MAKKRKSRDQKRKTKLAARAKRLGPRQNDLIYSGNKYKGDDYLPLVMATEMGLNEADVIGGNKLIDAQVREALEGLAVGLKEGTLPPLEPSGEVVYRVGQEVGLIQEMVRRQWRILDDRGDNFTVEDCIGMSRTLLNSIKTFTTPGPRSRGYLSFVKGFLQRGGIGAHRMSEEDDFEDVDNEFDSLIDMGEAWLQGDEDARITFYEVAAELIRAGEGEMVAEAALQLTGLATSAPARQEFSTIAIMAQRKQIPQLPG